MDFIGSILASPFICLGWIIVGAAAGALARTIMKSPNMPFFSDLLLGVIGAFVGGFLAGVLGLAPGANTGGIELVLANLVIATIGSMILIAIGRMISGRSAA